MAREVNRGLAYALHAFLGILAAAVPLLGLLQDAGLVTHDFAQGWGMIIVLGIGLPAMVLVPAALIFSVLPRPWDPALLLLSGLLLLMDVAMFFEFRDSAIEIFVGTYALGSVGLGLRWLVGHWKLRKTETDPSARALRRKAWLDRAYALHVFVAVMLLLGGQRVSDWLARWHVPRSFWGGVLQYIFVPAAVVLPLAAGFRHWPPLALSLLLVLGYHLRFFYPNPVSYYVLLLYFAAALFFGWRWFAISRKSSS